MQFDNSKEIITPDLTNILTIGGTALEIPYGITSARPSEAIPGAIRYNTTLGQLEVRGAVDWEVLPTSTTGSVSNVTGTYSGELASSQITSALGYTPVNKAGDVMTGNLGFPKTAGTALQIENGYGWCDLVGNILPRTTGTNAPTLKPFVGNIRQFAYAAGDVGDTSFHIPHDYIPGTDMFIHVHWSHNGTTISGNFQVDFTASYAKGFGQAAFSTPIPMSITTPALNITNTPQYSHRIDEIQLSSVGGSTSTLNTSNIEVDGFILFGYTVNTIPAITGGTSTTPFIIGIDLHYQSSGLPTKNKAPSFYA